ncbi:ribonuclease E/G [Mesorhizobium sp. ZMM04-5]|uniref:Ribonuclease E n=1 Tax=Mesorhizobium marinum TaxID=3228790 RepID=A0ABV3R455_9HYPH
MPNKMLIDSSHPEETRVVVVRGSRIEEFDFESQDKKQLKGNIYLARVTRVEPSLQAAFVEYGGNRHGFLAFSEIHPDYYQIPVADRQALLRAEAEEHEDEDEDGEERSRGRRRRRGGRSRDRGDEAVSAVAGADSSATSPEGMADDADMHEAEGASDEAGNVEAHEDVEDSVTIEAAPSEATDSEPVEAATEELTAREDEHPVDAEGDDDGRKGDPTSIAAEVELDVVSEKLPEPTESEGAVEDTQRSGGDDHDHDHEVESVGAEDALDEVRNRRKPPRRHYKIQEVIKRRQILLVQVVKEERGNKGAALTTYLSLAGRYSVLMPNTARGGGISRKITNAQDRKRLKEVVSDLEVPQGMGVILRTAGESRTKAEIKRDYEYLMRLWDNVRELTLKSTAPALVYEEGSLIKRSVRDLYNKDIDEILVSGEDGYREAKDFMRMLMPSHAKVVQPYRETTPLFARFGVEAQLDKMLQPQVTLKSGGYIIINQTEALVSIDVNSGRSTKEHSIEETALHTNLEAAEEVARQLRLRDLAGLIVIDFIDMEENRNNRAVEKRLKDHLKNDRARIQLGRISHFGLMEMSRQRIRASVLESTMKPCPHCGGTGHVRSDSSVALLVVRAIEEFLLKDSRNHIVVRTPASIALYVLNHKRSTLAELEAKFGLTITIDVDETVAAQHYVIARGAVAEKPEGFQERQFLPVVIEEEDDDPEIEIEADEEAPADQRPQQRHAEGGEEGGRKRKRRRRRRGGRDRDQNGERDGEHEARANPAVDPEAGDEDGVTTEADAEADGDAEAVAAEAPASAEDGHKKRRRGKRGGKRNRKDGEGAQADAEGAEHGADDAGAGAVVAANDGAVVESLSVVEETSVVEEAAAADAVAAEPAAEALAEVAPEPAEKPKKPRRASRSKKAAAAEEAAAEAVKAEAQPAVAADDPAAAPEPAPAEQASVEPVAEAKPETVRASRRRTASAEPAAAVVSSTATEGEPAAEQPKRTGWWQKRSFF